jgi:hypothetical protein
MGTGVEVMEFCLNCERYDSMNTMIFRAGETREALKKKNPIIANHPNT